jgi:hypothetical protein
MAYSPLLFTKNGMTVLSEDRADEIRLTWEGWTAGTRVAPSRASLVATLSDLDSLRAELIALIGSGGGGGTGSTTSGALSADALGGRMLVTTGTNPGAPVLNPDDALAVLITQGSTLGNPQPSPDDTSILLITI